MSFDLEKLVRPNILKLEPYSCARHEFSSTRARAFLDANESPYNTPINRYPDPLQRELKKVISQIKGVSEECIFLGNGSDEAIDLIFRIFCEPGKDNVVSMYPTYGMYEVASNINDIEYRKVNLEEDYSLKADKMLSKVDSKTKVIFICSPNNPTGNSIEHKEINKILENFSGIVVLDEAYSDFSSKASYRFKIDDYPNLIVLNTLSKAWASASIRLGMAFSSVDIILLMNKVKYPYNIGLPTQEKAFEILSNKEKVNAWVEKILLERSRVIKAFSLLPICKKVFPTDANFFLAKVLDAKKTYNYLIKEGIVVRDRSRVELCQSSLRITIGTPEENDALLEALKNFKG